MADVTPTVPTPIVVTKHESKFAQITKFLSWLTACLLAVSVLVALVSVTSERDDLRQQLKDTNKTLACRSGAAVKVNQAIINEQVKLAEHNALIGQFVVIIIEVPADDPTRVTQLKDLAIHIDQTNRELNSIGAQLQNAVSEQEKAVLSC
jgi:hypothetical protein